MEKRNCSVQKALKNKQTTHLSQERGGARSASRHLRDSAGCSSSGRLTETRSDPMFVAAMDEIKERVRTGYSRGWVVRKYATVGLWPSEAALCETYWRPGSRILDIGCGAGRTTLPLAANGYRTIGADLALPMVREARKQSLRGGLLSAWLALDATDLPFADCAFDGVLFSYKIGRAHV